MERLWEGVGEGMRLAFQSPCKGKSTIGSTWNQLAGLEEQGRGYIYGINCLCLLEYGQSLNCFTFSEFHLLWYYFTYLKFI